MGLTTVKKISDPIFGHLNAFFWGENVYLVNQIYYGECHFISNISDCSVALSGRLSIVEVTMLFQTNGLKIIWIPSFFTKLSMNMISPTHCPLVWSHFTLCLNFSGFSLHKYFPVYYTFHIIYRHKRSKVSWNESSKICTLLGGELPLFYSRSEYKEFAEFHGNSLHIPPTEILWLKHHGKVVWSKWCRSVKLHKKTN